MVRAGGDGDAGETLIEVLAATVILGIAAVAIVGGVATSIAMSDIHRKQASAGAYVRDFAEALENGIAAASSKYATGSAAGATYQSLYTPPNASYTASVTNVYCASGSTFSAEPCTDTGAQKVSLRVASVDGRDAESLDIFIRVPCRPLSTDSGCA